VLTSKRVFFIGLLLGAIATRFLEDSNLLANSVLSLLMAGSTLVFFTLLRAMRSWFSQSRKNK
jgi:hypothetical protein